MIFRHSGVFCFVCYPFCFIILHHWHALDNIAAAELLTLTSSLGKELCSSIGKSIVVGSNDIGCFTGCV
jgi:hypothetical protein